MGSNDYPDIKIEGVEYMKPRWDIERVIKNSRFVAGIIRGRTYMEAALCGKHYLDYKVDEMGAIISTHDYLAKDNIIFGSPWPKEEFYSVNVAKKIESLYKELI